MVNNNEQPRIPAGRREGGQFSTTDKTGQTQDLTATVGGDSAMVNAIVTAGAEAYVKGITAERVCAYLEAVGRNDLLSEDEAAMRLTPWKGLKDNGEPVKKKATGFTSEMHALVNEAPDQRYCYRLTEEGRQAALLNLLAEAHDRQSYAAHQLGFSDDAAEECATWAVNYRLAEATRNLGKPDKLTFDLLATTVLSNGVEDFLTRRVPDDVKEYGAFARLGSSFEGTCRVGSDFLMYEQALPEHTAEAKDALWDACARRRIEERLPDAWEAVRPSIMAKYGREPDDYAAFFCPKYCRTPLEYVPAEEDWKVYLELRAKAKAGDVRAQATMTAFDSAVKNAARHDATLLSDGKASTPFAKNRGSRKIKVPYQIKDAHVEGVRRGSLFVYSFSNGRKYFEAGLAQFRDNSTTSLQSKIGSDDSATELGDLLAGSRSGGSYRARAAADPAEIFDAGQRYASAAALAATLPDDADGNAKLRRLLDIDRHEGVTDKRARAMAIAEDITAARAEGVPEDVICRLWKSQWVELTDAIAQRRSARSARLKAENEAAKARLHTLAAQRRAAAAQAR